MFKQDQLLSVIKARVPNFRIAFKDESRFMKIMGMLLFFSPSFMTDVTTTIGNTVYFPDKEYYERSWLYILPHEYVHLIDYNKNKVLFVLRYLGPQLYAVLSLISILAIWNLWFLLCLLFLLFLVPLPSSGRAKIEENGYLMSCLLEHKIYGKISEETEEFLLDVFSGWLYYKMATRRNAEKIVLRITATAPVINYTNITHVAFRDILNLFSLDKEYKI